MSLTVNDLQNTLLRLFHARGLAAGRQVSRVQVEQLWNITTLRRGDLLDAIVRLSATGHLGIDDREGDTLLSLTPAGESAARTLRVPEGMPWQYLQGVLLPTLRQRQLPAAPGGNGRRHYESRAAQHQAQRHSHALN